MPNILVTGGTGYIGSHTTFILLKRGYDVVILDSNINSSPNVIDKIHQTCDINNIDSKNRLSFVKGDLRDYKLLENIFRNGIDIGKPIKGVIHFAGLKSVSDSVHNPLLYWDSNLNSSINLLKVMEKFSCKTIVFSSSATVYGKSNKKKIDEISEIKPINAYGRTKYAIETLLNDIFLGDKNSWRIANLRYFNPIGAHPSGLIGEEPLGIPNNLFPILLNVAAGKTQCLKIFGNDWNTEDGTCVRDYIHVMDLADAHIKTLEFIFSKAPNIYNLNLGTGIGTSVLELINIFKEVNNIKIPYIFTSRRKGDAEKIVANNDLAKKLLNWYPKFDIKKMCFDGWKWYKKFHSISED